MLLDRVLSDGGRLPRLALLLLVALFATSTVAIAQGAVGNVKPKGLVETRTLSSSNEIDWNLVDRVYGLICQASIREPKIVMSQAILETGWFRSRGLMGRNNLFGFRHVNYLSFDRLEDSIEYYKTWQDTYMSSSESDYFGFLERIKYAAPGYSRHVRKIDWTNECP